MLPPPPAAWRWRVPCRVTVAPGDVGELAFATDPGCWADEGRLAVEPSRPLVCRVTNASDSVRELIPERSLGEEADSQLAQPVGLSRPRLQAAPTSAH